MKEKTRKKWLEHGIQHGNNVESVWIETPNRRSYSFLSINNFVIASQCLSPVSSHFFSITVWRDNRVFTKHAWPLGPSPKQCMLSYGLSRKLSCNWSDRRNWLEFMLLLHGYVNELNLAFDRTKVPSMVMIRMVFSLPTLRLLPLLLIWVRAVNCHFIIISHLGQVTAKGQIMANLSVMSKVKDDQKKKK